MTRIAEAIEALNPSELYEEWESLEGRRPLPEGPWQQEPVKVVWVDKDTDLDCMIVRSSGTGALCGYVGVDSRHSLFGCDYDTPDVQVHGGLTFADRCMHGPPDRVVCHTPQRGRSDEIWWFGFDCAHAWDYAPTTSGFLSDFGFSDVNPPHTIYRDIPFVIDEVKNLARQLKEPGRIF